MTQDRDALHDIGRRRHQLEIVSDNGVRLEHFSDGGGVGNLDDPLLIEAEFTGRRYHIGVFGQRIYD